MEEDTSLIKAYLNVNSRFLGEHPGMDLKTALESDLEKLCEKGMPVVVSVPGKDQMAVAQSIIDTNSYVNASVRVVPGIDESHEFGARDFEL